MGPWTWILLSVLFWALKQSVIFLAVKNNNNNEKNRKYENLKRLFLSRLFRQALARKFKFLQNKKKTFLFKNLMGLIKYILFLYAWLVFLSTFINERLESDDIAKFAKCERQASHHHAYSADEPESLLTLFITHFSFFFLVFGFCELIRCGYQKWTRITSKISRMLHSYLSLKCIIATYLNGKELFKCDKRQLRIFHKMFQF